MTAERPGGDRPSDGVGLTASPANAETPAVKLCSGHYLIAPEDGIADCDECGCAGPVGERCQQTVIEA